jgi:hypothetical protein
MIPKLELHAGTAIQKFMNTTKHVISCGKFINYAKEPFKKICTVSIGKTTVCKQFL